jgi:N-acetyl-gamma-glutamyl-phosphate reductase
VHAVSGYSGGGKELIARYEQDGDLAFRTYALSLGHKHLPEMQQKAGLKHPPVFSPAVVPAHRGMLVEVPLPLEAMPGAASPAQMRDQLEEHFADSRLITVSREEPGELLLRASAAGSDLMTLHVFADAQGRQARLVARLDNLGKGAAGAAVQSLNLMSQNEETAGLRI